MLGRVTRGCILISVTFAACGRAEDSPDEAAAGRARGGQAGGSAGGQAGAGGRKAASGGASSLAGGAAPLVTGGVSNGGAANAGGANAGKMNSGGDSQARGGGASKGGASGGGAPGAAGEPTGGFGAEAGVTSQGGAGGEATCSTYAVCGCGCCGTGPTQVSRCYYPEAGETLSEIIAADREQASNPSCANAGCSLGELTACCLRDTSPPGEATYTASYYIGGYNRITINKTGADGTCATAVLVAPNATRIHTALETPEGSWSLERGGSARCAMSATWPPLIGAIGSVKLRVAGTECVVDVHATFFSSDGNGGVKPIQFEADGLALSGLGASSCR